MTLPKGASVVAPVVICICISYSMTSLAITRYKEIYGYNPWCHESSIAALTGLIVGGAIKFCTGSAVEFDNDVFFYVVLPPIIFSAGMSLKKKMFFRYISLITLFGVMGTVINFSLITAATYHATRMFDFKDNIFDRPVNLSWEHSMLLAAVLSGTDEVSALSLMPMKEYPRLGALIFGEGVLNDAISIVLFHVLISNHARDDSNSTTPLQELALKLILEVTNEVFLSFAIGVSCGLANARLLKSLAYLREHPIHQTVLLLLFAYLAYTIAESVGVSGILTLFVTAVTQGHYSWHSLSKPAQVATKINAVALSDIAEGFAFSYVGLSMWEFVDDGFHVQFSLFILFVVIASRLITILVLCCVCKLFSKNFNMPLAEQLAFTLGGIVRGCLCWAQILQIGEHRVLVTTTLFIVMTTSLAGGFLMPIIIPRLGLKSIEKMDDGESSPIRGTLLKRSYKSHPRQLHNNNNNNNNSSATERNHRYQRKLSVYNFNYHANADDDLYTSHIESPCPSVLPHTDDNNNNNYNNNNNNNNKINYGSSNNDFNINDEESADNDLLKRFSIDVQEHSANIYSNLNECSSLFLSDKIRNNNEKKNNDYDENHYGDNSNNQIILDRIQSPKKLSGKGNFGESFNRKNNKYRPKVQRTYGLTGASFRNLFKKTPKNVPETKCSNADFEVDVDVEVEGASVNSELTEDESDTNLGQRQKHGQELGSEDEIKGIGTGTELRKKKEQSIRRNEKGKEREIKEKREEREERENRLEQLREDKGDYGIQKTDIDNLNYLNDEMDGKNQLKAMSRHQIVLDKIAATTAAARKRLFPKEPTRDLFDDKSVKSVKSGHDTSFVDPEKDCEFQVENDSNIMMAATNVENSNIIDYQNHNDDLKISENQEERNILGKQQRTFSRWGPDINKYKKVNFAPLDDTEYEPQAKSRERGRGEEKEGSKVTGDGDGDGDGKKEVRSEISPRVVKEGKRINEKYSPHNRNKSEYLIGSAKQNVEVDLQRNSPNGELAVGRAQRCGSDPGARQKVYKSENFINWVRFDEEFLKPLFGGSQREYTSIPEQSNVL